ncbi:hypothetical protein [Pedobacter gandavensis]|uniref:hypothetical protein n=1 Tax=Pedobacter gandavensis TaxID=2679963 RepID=UPI00292FA3DE|nr:hypothetical protein [Pedobacter gandavensis]
MKHFYLLLLAFIVSSCAKEKMQDPSKLKNGQEVELMVDHRFSAIGETLTLLPKNEPAEFSLLGFEKRKPGYTYRVKAKFHIEKNPAQDGPDRWFAFSKVVSEQKYTGTEAFDISLIESFVPGGPFIVLTKIDDQYRYSQDRIQLSTNNPIVNQQLEEIWQHVLELRKVELEDQKFIFPRWHSIRARVIHDPNNFGKAYLVQSIAFNL